MANHSYGAIRKQENLPVILMHYTGTSQMQKRIISRTIPECE